MSRRETEFPNEPHTVGDLMSEAGEIAAAERFRRLAAYNGVGAIGPMREALVEAADALARLTAELERVKEERDGRQELLGKALNVLNRSYHVLFNMAQENEGAIFNRWPIHHEPLRSDARNLLPLINEVLGDD